MDDSKPPISSNEFRLRSASKRTSADIDPESAELTNSGELAAVERQNDPPDRPSVAVYCQNEEEVREGFLIALRAMGVAVIDQFPEPPKPPARDAEP
jgi:hypothetical protein